MNTNNSNDVRKIDTMVRDLKATLFDIIVNSESDINALEQVQDNELYKELQERYSSTLKAVISSSNGLTESMLALGKIHEEYQQLLATTQTILEQSSQYTNSPEPKQEVEEEPLTYSDKSTMAPEEENENSIEQEEQEEYNPELEEDEMENSDEVAVPEETQEEDAAPEQNKEDQEEMENSEGVAVPEETQEENAAPEQNEEDQEEMENSDGVAVPEETQEENATPQQSEEETNNASDAIVPIDITNEIKIDSIPIESQTAENEVNNNSEDITLTTVEDSSSSDENNNSSEPSNEEKENESQSTDIVLPIINEDGLENPLEEATEMQSEAQDNTAISSEQSNENVEESVVIPIAEAIPKEEKNATTEITNENSEITPVAVEANAVKSPEISVTIPTDTTLPAPEANANSAETKEVTFVRVKDEEDKAILINQNQARKLRNSKDFQKNLINFQVARQNATPAQPVQENTEEQLQQMLGQLPILYEQGKTKEAEEMSEKISVLSKKLNSNIAA